MTKINYQRVTGTHDVFGREQLYYDRVEEIAKNIADFYAFRRITTPILEEKELFIRSVGKTTDIVEKEMFTLETKGKDMLVLRPEGTASVFRAYIENGMQSDPQPVKLWYYGPFFRYERPQAGRYRQFWQVGFEMLGDEAPVLDAKTILIAYNLLKEIGFKKITVSINSIGCEECMTDYKKALAHFLKERTGIVCPDCKKRYKKNILRVLDCKDPKCKQVFYCKDICRVHVVPNPYTCIEQAHFMF
jgi:histidyl-tRNA synthetase